MVLSNSLVTDNDLISYIPLIFQKERFRVQKDSLMKIQDISNWRGEVIDVTDRFNLHLIISLGL